MNLYKVTTTELLATFYVVAKDPLVARDMAERQWKEWKYLGEGKVLKVELLAEDKQYGAPKNTWLLIDWEGRNDV